MLPVNTILRIMSLQAGPQDLPYSQSLLMRLVFIYIVSGLVVLLPGSQDIFTAIMLMALDLGLLLAFINFCLYTRNNMARRQQTLMACFGTGIVFQLLALPLVFALKIMPEAEQGGNAAAAIFYLLLISWQMSVMAHILRHAMEMSIGLTLVLSVTYLLLAIYLSNQLALMLGSA